MPLVPAPLVRPVEGGTPGVNHPITTPPRPKRTSGAQHVTLTVTQYGQKHTLTALLDSTPPQITAGYGNFDEITRPGRRSQISWSGSPARRMSLALILDAWSTGGSVVHDVSTIEYLAHGDDFSRPPTLTVTGAAIPQPQLRWCIAEVAWGDALRDKKGVLVRQSVALTLVEDAAASAASAKHKTPGKPRSGNTVPVPPPGGRVGLQRLAALKLGKASRWKEIAQLNKIRTPATVKAGRQVRLP